ncbi:peptidylprolyl isomerase [Salidesulfovibrio onnuriiensis]|uniref:peptidylprolyl isomerase n=1 Tax=Salidesulfovibrio onnuriiensis TaxID=2583823 RepID=UPI0011CA29AF|nr:peptidylprolyl isomerase [Salidesulfovibrio onnuriiensis]
MFKNIVLIGLLLISVGCTSEPEEMGVVARVNGRPILLSQLEFQHDLMQGDGGSPIVPSVEKLRSEYGQILGDLIVQELIVQELEKLGLEVSNEEFEKAENQVRSDYPEGAFEQVLIEEYIDLKAWRQQLKYHLAVNKFYSQVLRPQVKIDYKEAERYYKKHISDFYLPASLKLLVLRGPNRQLVERGVEHYKANKDVSALTTALGEVSARELIVREERLPVSWVNALKGIEAGGSTPIISEKFGFESIILLEKSPAKVLSPTQAYPLVEEVLLEQKLRRVYSRWLEEKLDSAQIEISEHLVPKEDDHEAVEDSGNATS